WAAKAGTPEQLVSNYTIMIDRSLWGPIVVAGLLGATFSSALTSLVGAPRILAALGKDRILPGGEWLGKTSKGEPRRAMLITGAIVLLALMTRDLNVLAPLITMFFLITYAVINVVMLAEASLGLMSFRPTLTVPRVVPFLGALGCVFAMFIVNPTFSLVAVAVVAGIYLWIIWRGATPRTGTVRSGIFVAFAEWAAGKVMELELSTSRAWKPSLLVPVRDPTTLRGEFRLLVDLTLPEGSLKILGVATHETVQDLTPRIRESMRFFRKLGVMATASVIDSAGYTTGIVTGLQALGSAFFHPNILVLPLFRDPSRHSELEEVIREARRLKVGIMVIGLHDQAGLGRAGVINLWISPRERTQSLHSFLTGTNQNLGILSGIRLARAWGGDLNLITVVAREEEVAPTERHMEELRDLCRVHTSARSLVLVGAFEDAIHLAPQADLHIIGLPSASPLPSALGIVREARASCLFVVDSGMESALA
ncbi:MAG: amino acid permease, partial [Gemmatimonadetes bacterium]|nr:amino acid permease [Gemmatimonadota bacterium]